MLFSSKHAGIDLCLGPFKDDEDWARKIREDNEREEEAERKERDSGLKKFKRRQQVEDYQINRMLCDLLGVQVEQEEND